MAAVPSSVAIGGGIQAPTTVAPRRPQAISTLALIGAMLAYANVDAWIASRHPDLASRGNYHHLVPLGVLLAWAGAERLRLPDLGLGLRGSLSSACWGLFCGGIAAVPIRLFFAFPLVTNDALRQPDLQRVSGHLLARLLGLQLLLGTAVFEEVAFRGLLHAKLVRMFGAPKALLMSSVVFAAWHVVITWSNLARTNLPRPLFPFLFVGAMGALFAAGVLLGLLRQATGHLAGSIVAHWMMVTNILLAVARPEQTEEVISVLADAVLE